MLKLLKLLFGAPVRAQSPKTEVAAFESPSDLVIKPAIETEFSWSDGGSPAGSVFVGESDRASDLAPAVQQPAMKSQAQLDSELICSQAWVEAVSNGERAWAVGMDALLAAVQVAQQEGRAVSLMMLSQYFWLKTPVPELGTSKLLDELRDRIEKDLSAKLYRAYIENKTKTRWNSYPHSVEFYVGEYLQVRPSYLAGLRDLFEKIPELVSIVEKDYDTSARVKVVVA